MPTRPRAAASLIAPTTAGCRRTGASHRRGGAGGCVASSRRADGDAFVAAGGLSRPLLGRARPGPGASPVLLAGIAVLVAGAAWLEGGPSSVKDLTLVATLGGLAAAGRVIFAPIPSVQPVTVIVAAAGVALGPRRGFAVGALAALASNFFLGQGPHAVADAGLGGCGLVAGLARNALRGRAATPPSVSCSGFAFGTLMDIWHWYGFLPHTGAALAVDARRRLRVQRGPRDRESRHRPRGRARAQTSARALPPTAQIEVLWA